jgi:photosystem II stability/assembly factor-like uncharacterized protein
LIILISLLNGELVFAQSFWQKGFEPKCGDAACTAFGPGNFLYVGSSGRGVKVSSDDGVTWMPTPSAIGYDFIHAILTTNNGSILGGSSGFGIYRSTDQGGNWTQISLGGGDTDQIVSIAQLPGGAILCGTYAGIRVSIDDGASWTKHGDNLGTVTIGDLVNLNADTLLTEREGAIWRSTNGGSLWAGLSVPSGVHNIMTLRVGPSSSLFLGCDSGLFITMNAGTSWAEYSSTLGHLPVNHIAIDSSGDLFVGLSPGGLERSTDQGATWTKLFDDTTGMYSTDIEVRSNGEVYYSNLSDTYVSSDRGNHWRYSNGFLEVKTTALAVASNGTIFAGSASSGVFTSTDAGLHWLHPGLINMGITGLVADLSGKVYTCMQGELGEGVSSDQGAEWSFGKMLYSDHYYAIAVADGGEIYVAATGLVLRSSDGGKTFLDSKLSTGVARALFGDPSGTVMAGTPKGIYSTKGNGAPWLTEDSALTVAPVGALSASRRGTLLAGGAHGMQRSTNSGVSWLPCDSVLKNVVVYTFAVAKSGDIYLGSDSGIYRSTNDGVSWAQFNDGLDANTIVNVMAVDSAGYLYASANDVYTIYRSNQPVVASVAKTTEAKLGQTLSLYPNPTQAATTISIFLGERDHATIALFDELGRERMTIFDGTMDRGVHNFTMNMENLPQGVYFCTLQTSTGSVSRVVNLLR